MHLMLAHSLTTPDTCQEVGKNTACSSLKLYVTLNINFDET